MKHWLIVFFKESNFHGKWSTVQLSSEQRTAQWPWTIPPALFEFSTGTFFFFSERSSSQSHGSFSRMYLQMSRFCLLPFLAIWKGVKPRLSVGFLSSKISAMHLYTSNCIFLSLFLEHLFLGNLTTEWRRVSPILPVRFSSFKWGRIYLQICKWPFFAALWRGVDPSFFFWINAAAIIGYEFKYFKVTKFSSIMKWCFSIFWFRVAVW